ncbi:hypothetical protein GCM10027343_43610 [Noviherbaspirillum agri]
MAPLNGGTAVRGEFTWDQAHFSISDRDAVSSLLQQAPKVIQRLLAGVNADEFDIDQNGLAAVLPKIHKLFSLAYRLENDERRTENFLAILVDVEATAAEPINDGQLDLVLLRQRHQRQKIIDQIVTQKRVLDFAMPLEKRWRTSPNPTVM